MSVVERMTVDSVFLLVYSDLNIGKEVCMNDAIKSF